jgi:SAM-dependent methyltransferase
MSDKPWRQEWDEQADDWVALTQDDPFYDRLNEPAFLELLPPAGRRTLDVGCGEGRLARRLTERGHHVVGLDGSEALARVTTQHRTAIPVAVADVTALPIPDAVADLVVCFMVLMDVQALERSVAELARVVTRDGSIALAILHPINTSGLFVRGDPNHTFFMGAYRTPMRHVLDLTRDNGQVFKFRVEHRPLEDYSRAFEAADLAITALREPRPSDEQTADYPPFADFQRVPNFLHVVARPNRW